MTGLLNAAQMRAIEADAIASGAVTGLELMERAGAAVVEAVLAEWPEMGQGGLRATVLCGPGNNGGDGFVIARLLKARGWTVEVIFYGDAGKLPPDARTNHDRWAALGPVLDTGDIPHGLRDHAEQAGQPELYIDALFGTGLNRPPPPELREDYLQVLSGGIAGAEYRGRPRNLYRVVSVDVPSGLCADSGRVLREASDRFGENGDGPRFLTPEPDLTVTFHAPKIGHVTANGPECCGKLVCKDIGLPGQDRSERDIARLLEPDAEYAVMDVPRRDIDPVSKAHVRTVSARRGAHKFDHGHALVLTGKAGRTGAARLAARGALRIGAGLVTLGVPGAAQMEVASQVTALMLRRVEDADALAGMLEDDRINALCLGPGLGVERARALVPVALRNSGKQAPQRDRAVVLDADALTAFEDDAQSLFDLLHANCVLTPHGGEFARLFPDLADRLNKAADTGPAFSRIDAAREAAARAGCVVLLKGPDTVIAEPSGRCAVNAAVYDRAVPWLATAGAGDVLAGFITGLLARGLAPMQAAELAAWLHVECARSFGPGLIAEDLLEVLPRVLRELGL